MDDFLNKTPQEILDQYPDILDRLKGEAIDKNNALTPNATLGDTEAGAKLRALRSQLPATPEQASTEKSLMDTFGQVNPAQESMGPLAPSGKSAEESASVFKNTFGEGVDPSKALVPIEEKGLVPAGQRAIVPLAQEGADLAGQAGSTFGKEMLGKMGSAIGKGARFAGPLADLYALYGDLADASDLPPGLSPDVPAGAGKPPKPSTGPLPWDDLASNRLVVPGQTPPHEKTPAELFGPMPTHPELKGHGPAGIGAGGPGKSPMQNIKITGDGLDAANELKNAQQQQAEVNLINSLGKAGAMFGSSLAKATEKPDTSVYDQNIKNSGQIVQNIKDQIANQENDPKSPVSQSMRQIAKSMGINVAENVPAAAITKQMPLIEKKYVAQEATKQRAFDAEQNRLNRLAIAETHKGDKAAEHQNQAMTSTTQLLESARGNPAAAQAERDLYAAQKAQSLSNLYSDPNNLSMPQVNMLAMELGKIASGQAPTMHELEGITPDTLKGKLSTVASKFMDKPTAAGAAEFVKRYQDYLKPLTRDAQKIIEDKYGRIIESRKGQLSDSQYKALQDNYLNRFKTPEAPAAASPKQAGGKIKVSNGSDTRMIDPSDLVHAQADGYKQVQ